MVAEVKPFRFYHPSRVLKNGFYVQPVHWRDNPNHDEAWADNMAAKYGGRRTAGWMREFEMDPSASGMPVWGMMAKDVHLRTLSWAETIGPAWTRYRVIDPGLRHPTCCGWVAVNSRGDQYWYRQYYATDRTAAENCRAILSMEAADEWIAGSVADTAAWNASPETRRTLATVYAENGIPLSPAKKDAAGYDAVGTAFVSALCRWSLETGEIHPSLGAHLDRAVLEELAAMPATWLHPACAGAPQSLYEECANLRWAEVRGDAFTHAQPQKPVDVNDDGADVVRYGRHTPAIHWQAPPAHESADLLSRLVKEAAIRGTNRFS